MMNSAQDARLKELTDLLEKERDHDKVTQLIAELNALLDEQKKPVSKSPRE
jgi:flagellar motility protein MotE (MotC chaperone)